MMLFKRRSLWQCGSNENFGFCFTGQKKYLTRLVVAREDCLGVGILVGRVEAWVATEIRPARMELPVAAHCYCSVVADEDALQHLTGNRADAHELDLRVFGLGGDAMNVGDAPKATEGSPHRVIIAPMPKDICIRIVQIDACGIIETGIEGDDDMPVVGRNGWIDFVGARANLEGFAPVFAIAGGHDEHITIGLDRRAGGLIVQAIAVIISGDVEATRFLINSHLWEAIEAEVFAC